jgi:hypothetical protein
MATISTFYASALRRKALIGFTSTRRLTASRTCAGFYESPHSGAFPKIQILTIEGLLSGAESPKYPDLARGALSFKKAKTEGIEGEQTNLLQVAKTQRCKVGLFFLSSLFIGRLWRAGGCPGAGLQEACFVNDAPARGGK